VSSQSTRQDLEKLPRARTPVVTKGRRVPPHVDTKSFSPSVKVKNGQPIFVEVKYYGGEGPYKAEWSLNDKVII
jgi:hypothetical protein